LGNDPATDRRVLEEDLFELKACDITAFFFGGRPLGLGGIIGIFLGEEDIDYLNFFFGGTGSTYRDLSKNNFFEILLNFSGHAKI
jgi:hypothetical protein